MSLAMTKNWMEKIKVDIEAIVHELAQDIYNKNPDFFLGKSMGVHDHDTLMLMIREAVATREDIPFMEKEKITDRLMGMATGYGPLRPFFLGGINLPGLGFVPAHEITEVMVNPNPYGRPRVFCGYHGRLYYAGDHFFEDQTQVKNFIRKTVESAGRTFGEENAVVDAWLEDGSRLSAFGFKVCPTGFAFNIRKSPLLRPAMPISKLVAYQMFPTLVMEIIINLLVHGHANFGCFGPTDSGKTTVVRSAAEFFNETERVLIGEVSFEVALPHLPNCLNLVEVNVNGNRMVTMNNICDTILRNNPDRTIVGEIRGSESVGASEISETSSRGFITTGHAPTLEKLIMRLPKMFGRPGGMKLEREFVNGQLGSMFNFILFFDKVDIPNENATSEKDRTIGKRILTELAEIDEKGNHKTIISFDKKEFRNSNRKVFRWEYENPVSEHLLDSLYMHGAVIKPEYEDVKKADKYLYCPSGNENEVSVA